jgi:hypothetical protein
MAAAHERDAQLRTDAVGARDEHRVARTSLAEMEQPAERAKLREHARREGPARQPLDAADHFVAGVDVHAGLLIVHS